MSWKVVPEDVQKRAVSEAAKWMASPGAEYKWSGNLGRWKLQRNLIQFADGNYWCVVAASSADEKDIEAIASAETEPIFRMD
jgi:hypothetical protein